MCTCRKKRFFNIVWFHYGTTFSSLSADAGNDCFIARNIDTINASYEVGTRVWIRRVWKVEFDRRHDVLSNDDAGVGHCTILIFQRNGNTTRGAATGDKSKQAWTSFNTGIKFLSTETLLEEKSCLDNQQWVRSCKTSADWLLLLVSAESGRIKQTRKHRFVSRWKKDTWIAMVETTGLTDTFLY